MFNRILAASAVVATFSGTAFAQSASVTVSHNDPDGMVEPGQTVRIEHYLSWNTWNVLGSMKGDATATPDAGFAANNISGFNASNVSPPYTHPGTPIGGSIRGFVAQHEPPTGFILPGFALGSAPGIVALSYDWTAPTTPGEYTFTFEFDPAFPSIYLYPQVLSPMQSVPTEVFSATLTVVPAPAPAAAIGAFACLALRRRR